jgi:hypothetical protein
VFSTGQRASTSLLDLTSKLFLQLPNAKERIMKKNQEQFFIRGDSPSDTRRLFSFPSSVAGLKGQGAFSKLRWATKPEQNKNRCSVKLD